MSEPQPPYSPGLAAIFDVVHRLRAPGGCPWDREQTHRSLRPYLLEETYEVLEALDSGDDGKLREELGDLLLQVAMHAEIAAQEDRFDAVQVSEGAAAKMVSRHPHVFGDVSVRDAEDVLRNWEHQKADEAHAAGRVHESVLDRVPTALPALAWTLGLQKRAARVGFDFPSAEDAVEAAAEEARELTAAAAAGDREAAYREFGDLLFALVNAGRKAGFNAEDALREAGARFKRRFDAVEREARSRGGTLRDLSAEDLQALWDDSPDAL